MQRLFPTVVPETDLSFSPSTPFVKIVHGDAENSLAAFSLPPSSMERLVVDKACFANATEMTLRDQPELSQVDFYEGCFRRVATMSELAEERRFSVRDCAKLREVHIDKGCFAHYTLFEMKSERGVEV